MLKVWLLQVVLKHYFKKRILDTYYENFNTEYSYDKFPLFEAISLLGTKIIIDNKGDTDND